MKDLKQFIMENSQDIYVLYYDDDTMYKFYYDEDEAKKEKEEQESQFPAFKLHIKKEPISNIKNN